ncbi:MAG: hypothetical protein PHE25_03405 [Candidatus Gracilibacteria bacterium]|nr:hypothetical protein [Candidatus Gracilibacteria bacterium]
MKKTIFLAILAVSLLNSCSSNTDTTTTLTTNTTTIISSQPDRKIDIYGKVISMEGNEITLLEVDTSKDPTFNMTPEEKKKYMTSLDEATRMALKAEINSATLGEIKLTIPVGIAMTKKTAQGTDAPLVEASLADVKIGGYLSVWLNQEITDKKIADFVKIAFIQ